MRLVTIRGVQHSGTGWLRGTLLRHCRLQWKWNNATDADGKYGWKHGMLPPSVHERSGLARGDFLIVLTRAANTWLQKMRAEPYTPSVRANLPMSAFLQQPWPAVPALREKPWRNVLEQRTKKYRSWRNWVARHNHTGIVLRYEDLLSDFPAVLRRLARDHCVPCRAHPYEPVTGHYKFLHESRENFQPRLDQQMALNRWKPGEWRQACRGLDLKLEADLGYPYPQCALQQPT